MMKVGKYIWLLVLCCTVNLAVNLAPARLQEECAAEVLDGEEKLASWDAIYNVLFDRDIAADETWKGIHSADEFDKIRRTLRSRMINRLGGFPTVRTPLNPRITKCIERDGYNIECLIFESRPGAYVTCNLYLPCASAFKPPYPAAIELCGHTQKGKNRPEYQRAAVLCAKNGVAVLVVDPLSQGERNQCKEDFEGSATSSHLRLGVNALLLGHGLAAFEMWDAIRALDYLDTRSDIRHGGYGAFGNSGGGTQSVMLSSIDDRIIATATACYLSNLRQQTAWRLLADSEQLIFAQLKDGLSHAAYPLLGGNPVLMVARWNDMIPFTGTRETFRVVSSIGEQLGRKGMYTMYDIPGPHGYCERNMRATAAFITERLRGAHAVFTDADNDMGPDPGTALSTSTGNVMCMPGFKSAYAYLNDELDGHLKNRCKVSVEALASLVRRLADIDERRLGARNVVSENVIEGGVRVIRSFHMAPEGYRVPVVELCPLSAKNAPALVVGDGLRSERMETFERALEDGHPVIFADIIATGEIGGAKHHYANPNDDEETAKMLYLLGSSLVGRRAGEIIALAKDIRMRYGAAPEVIAYGRTAVAAAHAFAAARQDVARVKIVNPPLSWSDAVHSRAFYDYASSIHGGLVHYDWTDLLNERMAE